jgi:membrane carboxypeptidase/penicillin-binding protein
VYFDPMLDATARLDRLAATAGVRPPQAIPARSGFLISKLLATTIEHGFSSIIRRAGLIVAGKTGTSSATMDSILVAYTARWLTTVWMGDDLRERPLGVKDAAYMTAEPVWARYMIAATAGHPRKKIPWLVPAGVERDDRGDAKGEQHTMPLVYRKAAKPGDLPAGLTPLPEDG